MRIMPFHRQAQLYLTLLALPHANLANTSRFCPAISHNVGSTAMQERTDQDLNKEKDGELEMQRRMPETYIPN